jgi:lipopolysaccharide/colanic/teichoic acid biosynthesis glycosyltransferase
MNRNGDAVRRALDVLAAATGILVFLPLMVLIGVVIRAGSAGPALFHQERIGQKWRRFQVHKFRTMRKNAAESGAAITVGGDQRITAIGRVLRRLKLDELPQLFNVLVGQMSLVGPRPEVPRYVDLYPEALRSEVLSVRPGITDLASLCYIDESELLGRVVDPERYYVEELIPRKLNLALAYVRHRSIWLDLRILAATLTGILGWRWIPAPWEVPTGQDVSSVGDSGHSNSG